VTGRPRWRRPRPDLLSADLVDRNFARSGRNQLWVTDITEHPTREGKVYCAVVLDTYSRRVVGWSIDASPTAALVTNASRPRLVHSSGYWSEKILASGSSASGRSPLNLTRFADRRVVFGGVVQSLVEPCRCHHGMSVSAGSWAIGVRA